VAPATLPSESTTWIASETFTVVPATYAPEAVMDPPEALEDSDQTYPVPLPPLAVKLTGARESTLEDDGVIVTPAVTPTVRVATLPTESVTWTTSETSGVAPAV
jgi:hypothetical protein